MFLPSLTEVDCLFRSFFAGLGGTCPISLTIMGDSCLSGWIKGGVGGISPGHKSSAGVVAVLWWCVSVEQVSTWPLILTSCALLILFT